MLARNVLSLFMVGSWAIGGPDAWATDRRPLRDSVVLVGAKCQITATNFDTAFFESRESPPPRLICHTRSGLDMSCSFMADGSVDVVKLTKPMTGTQVGDRSAVIWDTNETFYLGAGGHFSSTTEIRSPPLIGNKTCVGVWKYTN